MGEVIETFEHKGYKGKLKYSKEDRVYHGKIEDIESLVTFEGKTDEDAAVSFMRVVEDHIESLERINLKAKYNHALKEFSRLDISSKDRIYWSGYIAAYLDFNSKDEDVKIEHSRTSYNLI